MVCCAALAAVLAAPAAAADIKSKYDKGVSGSYRKQNAGLSSVSPLQGRVLMPLALNCHSALCTQGTTWASWVEDSDFISLVNANLISGGSATYDTLLIHMAQCFSGGFIDEVEDNSIPDVSINTSAWHAVVSWGTEASGAEQCYYSRQWIYAIDEDCANKKMLDAYKTATAADTMADKERPQYYSIGADDGSGSRNVLDNTTLETGSDKNIALLFVGTDEDSNFDPQSQTWVKTRGLRHYKDALEMQSRLKEMGYTDSDIYVYYHNGTAPGSLSGLVIDGSGTEANFNSFFNTVCKNNISGQNDKVVIWTGDHGSHKKGVAAQIGLEDLGEGAKAILKVHGPLELLRTATTGNGLADDPWLDIEPPDNLQAGETVQVFIGDFRGENAELVGEITDPYAPTHLSFSPLVMDAVWANNLAGGAGDEQGDLTVIFAGPTEDIVINSFELGWAGQVIPEPAALSLLAAAGLVLIRRKRR
ncbi:MAG: hypothetical protein AMJ81_13385 [Phycisphaerae bacterium SM23_33]|nr:MAG: hypothetical protein AMJ81_13385 [Phycisphaerae bacterium SM23_33]